MCVWMFIVFFFKQKTAYEMRISDWSSDVCSSDLLVQGSHEQAGEQAGQGRDKENSAEPRHFFCRPAQWQGKALEWRVSWAALCSTSICEKPTPQSRKTQIGRAHV